LTTDGAWYIIWVAGGLNMKLGDRIRYLRKTEKKMKLNEFHASLMRIFGNEAISYRSLVRIEKNQRDGHLKSLHQIACGLGMDVKELLSGTEREMPQEKSVLADIVRRNLRPGRFAYNDKASIEIVSSDKASFICMELVIEPAGVTKLEENAEGSETLLIVTRGKITADIYNEVHSLGIGDSIYFKSHLPHHFENRGKKLAKGLIIQTPKSF
jgi:quercetin dioxygenase-like cupin family protein